MLMIIVSWPRSQIPDRLRSSGAAEHVTPNWVASKVQSSIPHDLDLETGEVHWHDHWQGAPGRKRLMWRYMEQIKWIE